MLMTATVTDLYPNGIPRCNLCEPAVDLPRKPGQTFGNAVEAHYREHHTEVVSGMALRDSLDAAFGGLITDEYLDGVKERLDKSLSLQKDVLDVETEDIVDNKPSGGNGVAKPKVTGQEALDWTIRYLKGLGDRRVETEDVVEFPTLRYGAEHFVRNLPEDEDFAFLVSLGESIKKYKSLTDPQARGALRCLAGRLKSEQAERNDTGRTWKLDDIPAGNYAIEDDSTKLRFLRVDRPADGTKWTGWTFIKEVYGGNQEDRRGAVRPDGALRGTSPQTEALLAQIVADPMAAAVRYGRELGVCAMCGKSLTDEASRQAGIGPVCAKRFTKAPTEDEMVGSI